MKLLALLFLFISFNSFSQRTDTVYKYFGKDWKPVTKEQAFFVAKIFKTNNAWHRQDFWVSTNVMQYEGYYNDSATEEENGPAMYYNEKGIMLDSLYYEHGKEKSKYLFYENHTLKAYAFFDVEGKTTQQAGYTPDNKEIEGYIFQQEATFPGGMQAWQDYLVKGLTTKQPKAYQQGKISGKVVILFLVDKNGLVKEVTVGTSSGHEELDKHAIKVIENSPPWLPAVQYNERVNYRQQQSLTYAPQN